MQGSVAAGFDEEWPDGSTADTADLVTLHSLLPILRRSAWLIALTVAAAILIGLLYVLVTPARYVASTQIVIQPEKQPLVLAAGLLDLNIDTAQVESQIQILKSERIANDVIDRLHLMKDPAFTAGDATTDFERKRLAIAHFASSLDVHRVGESYVIEISFQSPDPELTAQISNATAAVYIHDQMQAKIDATRSSSEWMQGRLKEVGRKLNAAAFAVEKFKSENGLGGGVAGQGELVNQLTELEARAQAFRNLYESYLQKLTENEGAESYPLPNAQIIAAASRPLTKSYPKGKLVILFATLAGLVIGVGAALLRNVFDQSLRSAKTVRQVLALPCLGLLPRFDKTAEDQVLPAAGGAVNMPLSIYTIALKNAKISIDIRCRDLQERCICIGFLSLLQGEGKSTLCTSLAAMYTTAGSRTLLIDGDFRRASVSRQLAPAARVGLLEALTADNTDAICVDDRTNTHVLPLVDGDTVANSSDLLGSTAMQSLLAQLRKGFQTILVDLPALTLVPDARAVGPLLDGCVLVVEWGRTPVELLREAVEMLKVSQIRILGIVINKVDDGVPALFGLTLADLRDGARVVLAGVSVRVLDPLARLRASGRFRGRG